MKYNNILVFCLFLTCVSCKENGVTSISAFNDVRKIEDYEILYSDKNDPWGPVTDIEIVDSILVIKHANDNYHFSFIDVNENEILCRWGTIGEGPGEFLDFGSGFMVKDSQLVFLDRMKKQLNYVSIPEIVEDEEGSLDIIKESYPYTVDFRPFRISVIGKKKIAVGAFKEGHFGVLDSCNNIIPNISEDPFNNSEIQGLYRGILYQSEIKTNNKQAKFVMSTFASDIFEIYNVSVDSINRAYMSPFKYIPQIWKKGESYAIEPEKSIAGLRNLAVSDDLICFTFSLQSYSEAAKNDFASNELLCFNWDGEKVKKYILPFSIAKFCIDQLYIYGIAYQNEETIVYRFKL